MVATPTRKVMPTPTVTRSVAVVDRVASELVIERRVSAPNATTTFSPEGVVADAGAVIVFVDDALLTPLATIGAVGATPETATIRPAGCSPGAFHVYEDGSEAPATR